MRRLAVLGLWALAVVGTALGLTINVKEKASKNLTYAHYLHRVQGFLSQSNMAK